MEGMSQLKLSDFDYKLPKSLIAQEPIRERSQARLLVLHKGNGKIEHRHFSDLPDFLGGNDCLVLNDTKVLKARLFGRKPTGGRVEVLLHKKLSPTDWEVLMKPGGRVRQGSELSFGENGETLHAEVLDGPRNDSGLRRIRMRPAGRILQVKGRLHSMLSIAPLGVVPPPLAPALAGASTATEAPPRQRREAQSTVEEILESIGRIPLPPYIDRPDTEIDREFYQTVFAKHEGAVASPTAGLHFDIPLLEKIKGKGAEIDFVTLHVGYGTFQPVAAENIEDHKIHGEAYEVSEREVQKINRALQEGKRVIACGTTVVRTLESLAFQSRSGGFEIGSGSGQTQLFIYPPYSFKVTQGLITNFHLPKTTLLMLVAAFAGREKIFAAYEEAIRERYRFYSYGDAMLIL